jgi:hypothetical protein
MLRTPDARKEAMARAIEKDPSLGASDDPETLERLRQATDQILLDLETLRARQAIVDEKAAVEAETARLEAARVASVESASTIRAASESARSQNGTFSHTRTAALLTLVRISARSVPPSGPFTYMPMNIPLSCGPVNAYPMQHTFHIGSIVEPANGISSLDWSQGT